MDGIDPTPLPTVHSLGRYVAKETDERTALRSFEAYVIGEMLRQAVPQGGEGLFDGGQAGRMYRDHLYQEYARLIAEQGDFGLASQLEGHLSPEPIEGREQTKSEQSGAGDAAPLPGSSVGEVER